MNNLSSYRGLVDARISASDKDLPVLKKVVFQSRKHISQKKFSSRSKTKTKNRGTEYISDLPKVKTSASQNFH